MGKTLSDYRNYIATSLINNKKLCELVLNRAISNVDADVQSELITEHIFKYKHVPSTQNEEKTYITFDLRYSRTSKDSIYKNVRLYFYIFCHEKIIYTAERNLRTDLIDDEVQTLFNENADIGLGYMYLTDDDSFSFGTTYHGRCLAFTTKDQISTSCG